MINSIIRTCAFFGAAIAVTLTAIVCTRIPLFKSLGFEFSAVVAVAGGFIAGIFTLGVWKARQYQTLRGVRVFLGSTAALLLLLALLPFFIALGSALFIKNCSIAAGTEYYFLLAVPSFFFCGTLAFLVTVVFCRFQKTIFTGLIFLILAHIPLVALLRPQIFAFNPIIGYFPGITYDESINILRSLIIYRLGTAAASVAIASFALWLWERKRRTSDDEPSQHAIPELILLALLVPFVCVLFLFSDRIGLSSSEDFIRAKLGGSYRTAHCEIVYPSGLWKREYVERLGVLHEYYYDAIEPVFSGSPGGTDDDLLLCRCGTKGKTYRGVGDRYFKTMDAPIAYQCSRCGACPET